MRLSRSSYLRYLRTTSYLPKPKTPALPVYPICFVFVIVVHLWLVARGSWWLLHIVVLFLNIMAPSFFHTALLAALYNIHGCSCHSSSNQQEEIDCTRAFCQLSLSDELIKRYKVSIPDGNTDAEKCADCKITVQLVLDAYSWVGFGVSGNGGMIGSHVVM